MKIQNWETAQAFPINWAQMDEQISVLSHVRLSEVVRLQHLRIISYFNLSTHTWDRTAKLSQNLTVFVFSIIHIGTWPYSNNVLIAFSKFCTLKHIEDPLISEVFFDLQALYKNLTIFFFPFLSFFGGKGRGERGVSDVDKLPSMWYFSYYGGCQKW